MKHYKPISLLSVAYEIFNKVITKRIKTPSDFDQPNDQEGFRKGYSAVDHIHTINQVIEKCAEYNQPLYLAFIDFKRGFDSIEISAVMQALQNQGVEEPYAEILE